jgi:hypothetical protein
MAKTQTKHVAQPPESAKFYYIHRSPHDHGKVVFAVRATRARFYVRHSAAWEIKTAEEVEALIFLAEAANARYEANRAEIDRRWSFVERAHELMTEWAAERKRRAFIALVQAAHIRVALRSKTLEERLKLDDEKERLIDEMEAAIIEDDDFPELPEDWRNIAANPDNRQFYFSFLKKNQRMNSTP